MQLHKKTIGILGGMGPEATALFFHKIVCKTPAEKDQEHIKIVIYNDPDVPDRTGAIVDDLVSPVEKVREGLKFLKKSNVDFITIPCVTLHYYFDDYKNSVNIPVLNLIQETLFFIQKKYSRVRNIGVLATRGTYYAQIFEKTFVPLDYNVIIPDEVGQECVMDAIYGKEGIKAGYTTGTCKESIINVAEQLIDKGAEIIIGGCTEIPIVISTGDLAVPFVDTLSVLAEAAVALAGLEPRMSYT